MLDVAIVGGGLAGVSLAASLAQTTGLNIALFEANNRLGGRILCTQPSVEGSSRFDLGPTWVWPHEQTHLARFIQHHGLNVFPQHQTGDSLYLAGRGEAPQRFPDQQGYSGAYRIEGGAQYLLDVLIPSIPSNHIHLNRRLIKLTDQGDHVELAFASQSKEKRVKAQRAVLCLPPRLLTQQVQFEPALDDKLVQLFNATPTWMAGHGKVIVQYEQAFWRQEGLSGNAFANYPGVILGEIFDACNSTGSTAALGGFFALPAPLRQQYRDDLEALVLEQLFYLFGPKAAQATAVYQQDWFQEPNTAVAEDANIPPSHPKYGHQWLQLDHWYEKLWFAASETDPRYGGYLEGALGAAARMVKSLQTM